MELTFVSLAQKILMILLPNEEYNISELAEKTDLNRQTITNNTRVLIKYNLVTKRIVQGAFPPQQLISLTDKGRRIAEKLEEIEKILGE